MARSGKPGGKSKRKRSESPALIVALARGQTYEEAAASTGIPVRTIARRMGDPAFAAAVLAARDRIIERQAGRYAAEGDRNLDVLIQLRDGAESEPVRLGAARSINEYIVRLREQSDLSHRLARVEQLLSERSQPGTPQRNNPAWPPRRAQEEPHA